MINYEIKSLDCDTVQQLTELSKLWVEEDCSYGMVANDANDLTEPLAVAMDGDRIVGYIFGHFYKPQRATSCIEIGSDCFSVDELYVLPQYRSRGIGKVLYKMIEDLVKEKCSYMTLTTSTKNYKAILKLYIEELGMSFHSAFLIKDISDLSQEGVK